MRLLRSIYDVILDRSPEEVLGAIAIAVALSIALSGVFALFRRKVEDRVLLVIALMILACVTSMGFGAGYVMANKDRSMRSRPGEGFGPPGRSGLMGGMSRALKRADTDGDGRISPNEAAESARGFVAAIQVPGVDSVDYATLNTALLQSEIYIPYAIDPGPPPEPDAMAAGWFVDSADADGDRRISMEEATTFLKKADADGDGLLGRRELRGAMRTPSPYPAPFGPTPHRPSFEIPRPESAAPADGRIGRPDASAGPPEANPDAVPTPKPGGSTGP